MDLESRRNTLHIFSCHSLIPSKLYTHHLIMMTNIQSFCFKELSSSILKIFLRYVYFTCSAMLSLITMLPIWSNSCASEVIVVVAVAMFSTERLHMRRSSSQSASPVLPQGATRKPEGGGDDCTPSNSLTEEKTLKNYLV